MTSISGCIFSFAPFFNHGYQGNSLFFFGDFPVEPPSESSGFPSPMGESRCRWPQAHPLTGAFFASRGWPSHGMIHGSGTGRCASQGGRNGGMVIHIFSGLFNVIHNFSGLFNVIHHFSGFQGVLVHEPPPKKLGDDFEPFGLTPPLPRPMELLTQPAPGLERVP